MSHVGPVLGRFRAFSRHQRLQTARPDCELAKGARHRHATLLSPPLGNACADRVGPAGRLCPAGRRLCALLQIVACPLASATIRRVGLLLSTEGRAMMDLARSAGHLPRKLVVTDCRWRAVLEASSGSHRRRLSCGVVSELRFGCEPWVSAPNGLPTRRPAVFAWDAVGEPVRGPDKTGLMTSRRVSMKQRCGPTDSRHRPDTALSGVGWRWWVTPTRPARGVGSLRRRHSTCSVSDGSYFCVLESLAARFVRWSTSFALVSR